MLKEIKLVIGKEFIYHQNPAQVTERIRRVTGGVW